jgi:hypothetical protein
MVAELGALAWHFEHFMRAIASLTVAPLPRAAMKALTGIVLA